jgi:hypothetical protein
MHATMLQSSSRMPAQSLHPLLHELVEDLEVLWKVFSRLDTSRLCKYVARANIVSDPQIFSSSDTTMPEITKAPSPDLNASCKGRGRSWEMTLL